MLTDVTFSVPRGTRTALVGPSGAGKSTILALLERFYDVDAGVVRLGGVDVRRLSRDVLRGQFGYVEQDAPALAGTSGRTSCSQHRSRPKPTASPRSTR